jgi:hypothetical protein
MKSKIIIINIALLFISQLLLPVVFSVDAGYEIEVEIPYGPKAGKEADLTGYVKGIYAFALGIVIAAALGVLVVGGLMYMLSGTITTQEKAREYIWGAIGGLILALAAYLILSAINPDLVKIKEPDLNNINTSSDNEPFNSNSPGDNSFEVESGVGKSKDQKNSVQWF